MGTGGWGRRRGDVGGDGGRGRGRGKGENAGVGEGVGKRLHREEAAGVIEKNINNGTKYRTTTNVPLSNPKTSLKRPGEKSREKKRV